MADFKILFGKYIYILTAVALLGGGGLFAYLEKQGLQISCEDKVCEAFKECVIACEVYNPTYTSKYLYNYDDWKITFSPEIQDFKLYAKYYTKWWFTNFTRATRFTNIHEDRKYVFVFPKRATKYFQLRVIVNSTQLIKFNFGELDPIIIGYQYLYENLSKQIPIYEDKVIIIKENCENFTLTAECKLAYNYTIQVISDYKMEYYDGRKIGVKIGGKDYIGNNNVDGDNFIEWSVPIGDRNFEKFGDCRKYEKEKGVCSETNILTELSP